MTTKNNSALESDISSLFPDNTSKEIAPQDVRDFLNDLLDSIGFKGYIAEISGATTLDDTYYVVLVDTSGAGVTVTLPLASSEPNRVYKIKNLGANTVTVSPQGSDQIDGSASLTLTTQYEVATLIADDGSDNWYRLD